MHEPCFAIVQLAERPAVNREVAGSSPARGAIEERRGEEEC